MSDLSFETGQCCLENVVLGDEQFVFKCCGEITETQFPFNVKIQSLGGGGGEVCKNVLSFP